MICSICLGTNDNKEAVQLQCSHTFCKTCLRDHVTLKLGARRSPLCPLCRCGILDKEILSICPDLIAKDLEELENDTIPPGQLSPRAARRVERDFQRMAREAHLKRCPNCTAPIERSNGDDRVTCRCGHRFSWNEAPTVVPCRRVHLRAKGFPLWGATCPGCSKRAKVKLAAVRVGVVVGGPIVAVAAAGLAAGIGATTVTAAAVTAAVPAIACAPLAIAYEPVRRARGRSHNPFGRAMGSGARVVGRAIQCACDSD